MRRFAGILLTLLLAALQAAAQVDSTKLEARLGEYLAVLEAQTPDVKAQECDILIESALDPALRRRIALRIFDHYDNSPLMGDEAVAIHLIDKWFAPGKIAMRSDSELLDAKIFADYNRKSLLGMEAPTLELEDQHGETVRFGGPGDGFRVLYFFDIDCSKCKLETFLLRDLLERKGYPVGIYTVYVGRDKERWEDWIAGMSGLGANGSEVHHLWDPEVASDYQSKYGVLRTPRMFLVGPDGKIVGRGLDTAALGQLLDLLLEDREYSYGSDESRNLLDKLFATYGTGLAAEDVMEVAGMLRKSTLDIGDTLSFKHLEGDLLYYLSLRSEEPFREGSLPFIGEYVLSRPDIWNTEGDSLMVVGMAKMMEGLLSRTPVGSKVPKLAIKGWNKFRRRGGYLFFHSEGCPACEAEMARADSLGLRYFSVDMDTLEKENPALTRRLLDTFDLSGLPYVMEIGKRGVVKRRYVSMVG